MRHLPILCLCLSVALSWSPPTAEAVTIEFDYTYDGSGFFSDSTRRATLEAAAAAWERELEGVPLPAIPLGTGINTWTLSFNRPDQAATFEQTKNTSVINRPLAEDTIVIYVGARPDVYGGFLGYAEFGYSAFGNAAWLQIFQDRNNGDHFSSFGGAVSFDSDAEWHFDPNPETKEEFPDKFDFYTIALHEIGHLLGFTPDVPAFARRTLGGNFVGPAAVALFGSAPPFGFGGHWPEAFEFAGKGMVMAANLLPNVRNHINPLEVAILRDLGYRVPGGGRVRVTLEPPAAVAAGARWQLNGGPEQVSGAILTEVEEGEKSVQLKAVPGFITAAAQTINVVTGELLEVVVTYQPIPVPVIVQGPTSQWVATGQSVSLAVEAEADGAELSYQWRKAGKAIKNARAAALSFSNVGLTVAGRYDVQVRSVAGLAASVPVANLGVIGAVTGPAAVNEGGTLTLVQAAAGPGISYQWLLDGLELTNDTAAGVSGVDRAKLVITKVKATAAGVYSCRLRMPDAAGGAAIEQSGSEHSVTVTLKPVVDDLVFGPWRVGGAIADQVTAQNHATRFAVSGLPRGVIINSATGLLTGKPRLARPYRLVVTAFNSAGRSEPKAFDVLCEDFAPKAQGSFDGIIERGALNLQLGGGIKATVTSTAAFSGRLSLGRATHRFGGVLDTLPGPNATAAVVIRRGRVLPVLTLTLQFDAATGELTGAVADGAQPAVELLARRNPWHRRNQPATGLEGTYTAAIRPLLQPLLDVEPVELLLGNESIPQPPPNIPMGAGFVTAKVSSAGVVSWAGRLADGSVLTRTSTLSDSGQSSFHALLYGGTGSTQGWNEWTEPGDESEEVQVDGEWDWFKQIQLSSKVTNYRGGFPLHELEVTGGKYLPPMRGERVLEIAAEPERNARLSFVEGGIQQASMGAAASVDFTLNTANKMEALPTSENVTMTRLTRLVANTGSFQGQFVLRDPRPGGGPELPRRVTFFGMLVPRLGKGFGYFLLPELTELKPVPVLSGRVALEGIVPPSSQ